MKTYNTQFPGSFNSRSELVATWLVGLPAGKERRSRALSPSLFSLLPSLFSPLSSPFSLLPSLSRLSPSSSRLTRYYFIIHVYTLPSTLRYRPVEICNDPIAHETVKILFGVHPVNSGI